MAEFVRPIAVRYLEVDGQGVVFNMWYLAYIDDAMTAYLVAGGLPYQKMIADGYDVQLVHAELDWKDGLRFQDDAELAVSTVRIGSTSFTLRFEFRRDGRPAAAAQVVYVCIGTD